VDRLTSAEAGLYDQITARAKVEDVNAKALKQQSALAGDFAGATSVALTTFTDNVHDAAGAALQFVQGIANALLQQTAIQPASEAIGSGIASYFSGGAGTGTTPSRLGNVFDQTGLIHRFAYGDVVDSRTRFYFGGGQRGEMGEAGPEAVMPLRRGSDGKLGVAAAGGGATSITLNFPHVADGHGVRRSAQQSAAALARQMERRG
jgi:lambda family phage tail tape measure protein